MARATKAMAMAMTARIRRSRSSMRWATKGCSVPSVPSGLGGGGVTGWGVGAEAGGARGARLHMATHAVALLVPKRRGPTLEAPVLARRGVGGGRQVVVEAGVVGARAVRP